MCITKASKKIVKNPFPKMLRSGLLIPWLGKKLGGAIKVNFSYFQIENHREFPIFFFLMNDFSLILQIFRILWIFVNFMNFWMNTFCEFYGFLWILQTLWVFVNFTDFSNFREFYRFLWFFLILRILWILQMNKWFFV